MKPLPNEGPIALQTTVTGDNAEQRLDKYMAGLCSCLSRSAIQKLIGVGNIRVNGEITKPGYRLKVTDEVTYVQMAKEIGSVHASPIPLNIVYEDSEILVIDKQAGLATHPGPGNINNTLANALLNYIPELNDVGDPSRPGIVHRLDKDTSGLLIVAKTQGSHDDLSWQFKSRHVLKRYLALVNGKVIPSKGVIDAPIGRHFRRRKKMAVIAIGRPSVTRYETLESFENYSLLDIVPKTGRTHQIRVHLAAIGHPVFGDKTYGSKHVDLQRQFLHASYIKFRHPTSGQDIELFSKLPMDLSGALRKMTGS